MVPWDYFGVAGGPHFKRFYAKKNFATFLMLKICPNGIYLKVMAIGAIVSKLESSSLGQNIARPGGGR